MIIVTKDDEYLCAGCYSDRHDDYHKNFSFYVPDDEENWPQTCEDCGTVFSGPGRISKEGVNPESKTENGSSPR